jgi:hypothetical protein
LSNKVISINDKNNNNEDTQGTVFNQMALDSFIRSQKKLMELDYDLESTIYINYLNEEEKVLEESSVYGSYKKAS